MIYTDAQKIEKYLNIEIEETFQDEVDKYADAVSRMMDNYAGRTLVADTDATTRYFDGSGKDSFAIDEAQTVTALSIGDEYGDNMAVISTYDKYPKGGNAPISTLYLRSGSFTEGRQNVSVTGRFGYLSALPADIELCATMLVSEIVRQQMASNKKDVKSESIGSYSVTYESIQSLPSFSNAISMIDRYKKLSL